MLVAALASPAAERTTFELVAETGGEQADLESVFAALDTDPAGSLDGVRDAVNQPLEDEPDRVRQDLARW